jgi:hypothetical protein
VAYVRIALARATPPGKPGTACGRSWPVLTKHLAPGRADLPPIAVMAQTNATSVVGQAQQRGSRQIDDVIDPGNDR